MMHTKTRLRHPWHISRPPQLCGILAAIILLTIVGSTADAQDPVSPDAPTVFQPNEIQHGFAEYDTPPDFSADDVPAPPAPYDGYSPSPSISSSDQKPGGVFQNLDFAESAEEERTIRSGHIYVPVNPATTFSPNIPSVSLVFAVHKHLTSYQIIGRLFLETGTGLDPTQWLDEDIADLATEDESGFLKFFPPGGAWQPGQYRVDIYVGYIANPVNKMGTMRFSINPSPVVTSSP